MINVIKNTSAFVVMIISLLILSGCTHHQVRQVGSHKVTVARHGFQKKLNADKELATLEYEGVSTTGEKMKVQITGDKVVVNGVSGGLRAGDSVLIGDEGVAVNSLDYGESEKYLRANNPSNDTARN